MGAAQAQLRFRSQSTRQLAPALGELEVDIIAICNRVRPISKHEFVRCISRIFAQRRLDVGTVEAHALCSQSVDIGRMQIRMTIAAQVIPAELVEHDEQDVLSLAHSLPPMSRRRRN